MPHSGDSGASTKTLCLSVLQFTNELWTMSADWLWMHLDQLVDAEIKKVFGVQSTNAINTTAEQALLFAWNKQVEMVAAGYDITGSILNQLDEFIGPDVLATTVSESYLNQESQIPVVLVYRDAILRWWITIFEEKVVTHTQTCNILAKLITRISVLHEYRHCCQAKRLFKFSKSNLAESDADEYARQVILSQLFLEKDW
jgi:hypothetical protein